MVAKKFRSEQASSNVDKRYIYGHLISSKPNDCSVISLTKPSGDAPSQGNEGLMTSPHLRTDKPVLKQCALQDLNLFALELK